MNRKILKNSLIFLAIFAAYIGLRSHTYLSSFPHDEGIFLYGGQAWAHGEVPYKDFWDHKPPATFLLHSLPFRLFPFSLTAVKTNECLWLAASAFLIFLICKKRFNPAATVMTLLCYVFYTSSPFTIRSGGLTEESALFFVALSFWLILQNRITFLKRALFAGLAVGAAIQFRQTFVFASIFLLGASWHHFRTQKTFWLDFLKSVYVISIGMILPELLFSLYFFCRGAWYDFFEASYLYNFFYVGPARASKPLSDVLSLQWTFIQSTGPYLLAPILLLTTIAWTKKDLRWMPPFLFLVFLGDAFAISLSGEFYEHYYVQAAVSLNLILAFFWDGIVGCMKSSWMGKKNYLGLLYASLIAVLALIPLYGGVQKYIGDYKSILKERSEIESPYGFQCSAADAVQSLTNENDRILLIGRDPNGVYMKAKRYAASRFFHYTPLWKDKLEGALTERHEKAFIVDIKKNRPALILLDRRTAQRLREDSPFIDRVNEFLNADYTELEDWVEKSPEDVWFWYGPRLTFLIRNDLRESVTAKYDRIALQAH